MKKNIAILAFAASLLAACGGEPAATDENNTPVIEAAPTDNVRVEKAEPQIGDKIPEPRKTETDDAENSNRLAAAGAAANALQMRGVSEIGWEELLPEGEEERLAQMYQQQMSMLYSSPIAEGSAADTMVQIGTFNTVKELNETKVRIPGYTVPFEFGSNAEITEFLLVPYYGACLHAPPPPPNQTIFVMTDEPIKLKDLAQAVWIEGTIYTQTQESDLADAAYTIKMDVVETYEY